MIWLESCNLKTTKTPFTLVCEKTCSSLSIKKVAQKMNESSVVFISFSVGGKAARSLRLKKTLYFDIVEVRRTLIGQPFLLSAESFKFLQHNIDFIDKVSSSLRKKTLVSVNFPLLSLSNFAWSKLLRSCLEKKTPLSSPSIANLSVTNIF